MNLTNSKNMTLMILLFAILVITFSYAFLFNHDRDVIYTDLYHTTQSDK